VEPELRHLRAFVALAEEESFSRAAERLHLTQSSLSGQIRQLEERLGCAVAERTSRSVALTPAGEALLVEARRALAQIERAWDAARAAAEAGARTFTLGLMLTAGHDLVPELVAEVQRLRPGVRVEFHSTGFEDPSGGLRSGAADASFVAAHFDTTGIELLPLASEPLVAVMAASHPLASRPSVAIADLVDEPWIDAPTDDQVLRRFWSAAEHRGGRPVRFAARMNSYGEYFEAVRSGLAVGLLPEWTGRTLGRSWPGLAFVPVADLEPATLALAWRADDRTDLVDALVGRLSAARRAP
jgi:DNA-binding transcriptional LysR family regulator